MGYCHEADIECNNIPIKMWNLANIWINPSRTLNTIAMITRISGQALFCQLQYFSRKCAKSKVVEIAVSLWTRPLQYAQSLHEDIHYHEIVHYKCSSIRTPQHRVLEYTLNMGSILFWIRKDLIQWAMHRCMNVMWEVSKSQNKSGMVKEDKWTDASDVSCTSCPSGIMLPRESKL